MELKAGYKQTEVGVIPEEWSTKSLPEVCWFQEGPGVRAHQFRTAGVKLLNGTNISNGQVKLDTTVRYISIAEASASPDLKIKHDSREIEDETKGPPA